MAIIISATCKCGAAALHGSFGPASLTTAFSNKLLSTREMEGLYKSPAIISAQALHETNCATKESARPLPDLPSVELSCLILLHLSTTTFLLSILYNYKQLINKNQHLLGYIARNTNWYLSVLINILPVIRFAVCTTSPEQLYFAVHRKGKNNITK